MKNKITLALVFAILLFSVLGCSRLFTKSEHTDSRRETSSRNSDEGTPRDNDEASPDAEPSDDKSIGDKAVDAAVGEEKIGVKECDEIVDRLAVEMKGEEDENYIVKAGRQYVVNMIRESIRKSIEENKDDPAKMAAECKKFAVQLDKAKAEEKK